MFERQHLTIRVSIAKIATNTSRQYRVDLTVFFHLFGEHIESSFLTTEV
jgi:hypothetical protein